MVENEIDFASNASHHSNPLIHVMYILLPFVLLNNPVPLPFPYTIAVLPPPPPPPPVPPSFQQRSYSRHITFNI